jgi:hypothetical protein
MPTRCRCGERMKVDSSRRAGGLQVRYLECTRCKARRREVVDADQVWRRKR